MNQTKLAMRHGSPKTRASGAFLAARRAGLAACLGVVLLCVPLLAFAGAPVAMRAGESRVQSFNQMRRVWVVDPGVADVVVGSLSELLIHAKAPGSTRVYVWDKAGRHEIALTVSPAAEAAALATRLRERLGTQLSYKPLAGDVLLVEGEVERPADQERARKMISALSRGVQVVDMIVVKDANLKPSERSARALRQVLGEGYDYLLWDDETVIVRGEVQTKAEWDRIQQILEAANSGKPFANGVRIAGGGEPPVTQIAAAIGPLYHVWPLAGGTVVVEGSAPDDAAKKRVDAILKAFEGVAPVVNLTTVSAQPSVPLQAQRDLLQAALGEKSGIHVRVAEGKALLVEGLAPDEASLEGIRKILALYEGRTPVVDLVRVGSAGKRTIVARVKVVDVNRTALQKRGFTWGHIFVNQQGEATFLDQPFIVGVQDGVDNYNRIGALVEALVNDDNGRILAEPELRVSEGEEATFLVGGELPIPVPGSAGGVSVVTITYKEYGIRLRLRGTVRSAPPGSDLPDRIELDIMPEVSSIDPSTAVVISGISVPGFRTRRAQTKVDVYSGQTLALGGLISREESETISKIPVLGDIPIIGEFFRHKRFRTQESELILLVTPEVVEPQTG